MEGILSYAPLDFVENDNIKEVLRDFWVCCVSREASLLSRKEVLTGKAKFGITGDGKEVPQVAMARAWAKGDFRAGYYRDQTLLFALGLCTVEEYFAQLYADVDNDPFSRGRQMNSHFATALNDKDGNWLRHTDNYNISADISPTAGQMARSLGLAMASSFYRNDSSQDSEGKFSHEGNEVCFCTIGDASTSEGVFWETVNAACVTRVPLAISVWDDGYGISVPIDYQTTKKSISKALKGFKLNNKGEGMHIYRAKAWDYPSLVEMYVTGIAQMRQDHVPALFHVNEVTQPQGHSTSGSHERYKSEDRMLFEKNRDCIQVMQDWIIDNGLAEVEKVLEIREHAIQYARNAKKNAWNAFQKRISEQWDQLKNLCGNLQGAVTDPQIQSLCDEVRGLLSPGYADLIKLGRKIYLAGKANFENEVEPIRLWAEENLGNTKREYAEHLYLDGKNSALNIPVVAPEYGEEVESKSGYTILNEFFDYALKEYPEFVAFGEDVGQIGDVNQGFAGLQDKYGEKKVFDTGIREWTIIGQAIGLSMRGIRPLAEIQYLDYLIYALSPLSDDLATLRYRSAGIQQAPAIIRTRGHRLEGIWHAGSPLGMILNSLRGMHVLVPRNMTVAAGFYNTLLKSKEPGLVIESLNGYRLKEAKPINIGEYTTPLGRPEILSEGTDITLVTYGSLVRVAQRAVDFLSENFGYSVDLIDVQSLIPFDLEGMIGESVKKTNRLLIVDEDVPGGGSAYILQQLMEKQKIFFHLDSEPVMLTAAEHRPPFGSDGDYFCKPNMEDIVEKALYVLSI